MKKQSFDEAFKSLRLAWQDVRNRLCLELAILLTHSVKGPNLKVMVFRQLALKNLMNMLEGMDNDKLE